MQEKLDKVTKLFDGLVDPFSKLANGYQTKLYRPTTIDRVKINQLLTIFADVTIQSDGMDGMTLRLLNEVDEELNSEALRSYQLKTQELKVSAVSEDGKENLAVRVAMYYMAMYLPIKSDSGDIEVIETDYAYKMTAFIPADEVIKPAWLLQIRRALPDASFECELRLEKDTKNVLRVCVLGTLKKEKSKKRPRQDEEPRKRVHT